MKTTSIRLSMVRKVLAEKNWTEWKRTIDIEEFGFNFFEKNKPFVWGVNWAAIGTASPEETMKFASDLQEAAMIAEKLTKFEIIEDYSLEEKMITKENYQEQLESLKENFNDDDYLLNFLTVE